MNEKVNILMVDDQPAKLLSYEVILSELGENLIKATSGREALEHLLNTDVAVVLIDVSMPELNGFELADMIREHPRFQKTAIIFISAVHLTDMDRLKGYERGAVDYISVPVIPELLRAKVSVFAELHRKARQLGTLNRELEQRVLERTEQIRKLNGELQERVAELETIMQVLPIGVSVAHDPECRFVTGNAALSELMGMKQGDNISKSADQPDELSYHFYQNGRPLTPDELPVQRAATNRELVGSAELEIRRRDGHIAHLLASARPLFNDVAEVRGAVGVFFDVTERKHLEHQVQELQKFEAIGRLAGGIAHDFNNALGVILGWAQLGCDNVPDNSPVRENLRMIRDQAQRSAGLTRQLLAFARRQVLQPRSVNLNDLVSRIAGLLKTAIGEQTELKIALAPDLQMTMADPTQIEQVLMNLCLNARDAMPQGGRIVIETQNVEIGEDFRGTHSRGQPGRYVLLSVSDTGVGMDAATLDRIFEPFFTTKEMGRGTGLGLATVYGVVNQHGGFMNVSSEPGQGTTFQVYLPASSGLPGAIELATSEDAQKGGTETILVAEDHDELRELVRKTLASQGYSVILASNGQEAVRMFKANSEEIRLVVLDVVMPFLSGPEAHSQMCTIRSDLPVIFMSGHVAESVPLNSRITAGAAFLQKPCTPQALSRTVRNTLDAKNFA